MSQDQNPSSARNVGGLIVHTTEFKYALENDRYAFQNSTLMRNLDGMVADHMVEDEETEPTVIKSEPEDEDTLPERELQIDLSQSVQPVEVSNSQQSGTQANRLYQLWWETVHSASQVIIRPPQLTINMTSGSSPNASHPDGSEQANSTRLLYKNGCCQWPGCSTTCPTVFEFLGHLSANHELNEKTIAQFQVQAHVVSQFETKLVQERARLYAMYTYLNGCSGSETAPQLAMPQLHSRSRNVTPTKQPAGHGIEAGGSTSSTGFSSVDHDDLTSQPTNDSSQKTGLHGTDIEEIRQALESHRYVDQRPPFTYALLIRQAILESPEKQLTLNDVYEWFSRNFVYFKRNLATWKNAVRHNLSLHKCFVRVENLTTRGAVWMCDDQEFLRRRTQRSNNALRESQSSTPVEQRAQPPMTQPIPYTYSSLPPSQQSQIVLPPINIPPSDASAIIMARSPVVIENSPMGTVTPTPYGRDHSQPRMDGPPRMLERGMFVSHPAFSQTSIPLMSRAFFMHGNQPATANPPASIRYVSSEEATAKWESSDQELEYNRSHGSPDSIILENEEDSPTEITAHQSSSKRRHQDDEDGDNTGKHPRL